MEELLPALEAWRAEGRRVGRAVVVRTFGSAPRREGAVLLVADDGRMVGSVSGGCVEGAVAEEVLEAMRTGHSRVIRYGISDEQAWSVGLACGGTIDVLVEPTIRSEVQDAARRRGIAVATWLPTGEPPGPIRVVASPPGGGGDERELSGSLREAAAAAVRSGRSRTVLDDESPVFIEAFARPPRLVIVGATEIGRHLADLARRLEYRVVVVDPRAAFATIERFPDADEVLVAWPDEAFDRIRLGPEDAVAVLSHDPKVDEPAIVDAVRRGAGYVGAVGSRRTQLERRERLLGAGLTEADLRQVHGPIGLDLGGQEPVETALAVLAEIVAARRGGSGQPLVERSGPIGVGA